MYQVKHHRMPAATRVTEQIMVRMRPADASAVRQAAADAGVKVSAWLRSVVLPAARRAIAEAGEIELPLDDNAEAQP